jgi:FkbM family methyltransferase
MNPTPCIMKSNDKLMRYRVIGMCMLLSALCVCITHHSSQPPRPTGVLLGIDTKNVETRALQDFLNKDTSYTGGRLVRFEDQELFIIAPKNDEVVGKKILTTGQPYDSDALRVLLKLARPESTVVDAGGNIGSYTAHLASRVGPKGRVYAFEPQRKMFMTLCANAAINSLYNVYPQHAALSFRPDQITMSASVPDGRSRGVDLKVAESQGAPINYGGMSIGIGGEPTLARTLDSYKLINVSLIKLDVQGAEPLAIWGARETISTDLPAIFCEETLSISNEMRSTLNVSEEVATFSYPNFLHSLGYTSYRVSTNDRVYVPVGHSALSWLKEKQKEFEESG